MAKRVAFAVVAIPVLVALLWLGGAALAALVALAALLGTRELVQLARQRGVRPHLAVAALTAAVFPIIAWRLATDPGSAGMLARWPWAAVVWLVGVLLLTLWRRKPDKHPLGAAAVTVLAPLYAGAFPAFLLVLRHGPGYPERSWAGAALVLLPLVVTWAADSVAMEAGRRLGGPKFAPVVSPGKTWSGTVAGFLGAMIAALIWQQAAMLPAGVTISSWQALAVGAVVGSAGQLGDLVESLFKREAGVKDSSRLLPGHGGVLDRLDSLYFAIPLTAVLYHLFGWV